MDISIQKKEKKSALIWSLCHKTCGGLLPKLINLEFMALRMPFILKVNCVMNGIGALIYG